MNCPTDVKSREAVLKSVHVLPWVLADDMHTVTNPDGSKPSNFILSRVRFTQTQIRSLLLKQQPKLKMTIITLANSYYLKDKDNRVHSTRYKSREAAAQAAHKIAKGLCHFTPTVNRITSATNFSNKL
jgi:hypothetical protein